MSRRITWRAGKVKGARGQFPTYWGEIVIPDNLGHQVAIRATANQPAKALARASSTANQLLKSAMDNPAIAALLPPGAGPAIQTVAKVLQSQAAKKAGRFLRKLF